MPYCVYAIRLDHAAMGDKPSRAFRDQNWHIDWDFPLHDGCEFYYVGQSVHTPDCRFRSHAVDGEASCAETRRQVRVG